MRIYTAIDLETTGLDPQRDAIIEIGAVKFRGDEVLEEWSSLVDPGRSIPEAITDLTGISNSMVQGAPSLRDVLPRLSSFVRDLPVVGHNVSFDLSFLNRCHVLTDNLSLDTFELAGILVPHAGRYGLGALAKELGIDLPATHRALDDARVTCALFTRLYERATQIAPKTLEEIVKLGRNLGWSPFSFFEEVYRTIARGAFERSSIGAQLRAKGLAARGRPTFAPLLEARPLLEVAEPEPLDVDALAAMLEEGGALSQSFPAYEYRPQQVEMLRAVARTFNEGGALLVEAGTGTGKSLAYLMPAVHWAHANGQRVVISTNTINLQEQLYEHDVPDLQKILPFQFRASVLKGRSHYLCPQRLNTLRRSGPQSPDEMRVLCKVLLWLPNTVSGDGDELFLPTAADRASWSRLSADNEACSPDRCAAYAKGRCWFYRARRAAEAAHLVIVNHALLLADVAVENRALPAYDYLVVDEAHHLEDATTRQLSFQVSHSSLTRSLDEVGRAPGPATSPSGHSGLLADLVGRVRHACPPDLARPVQNFVDKTGAVLRDAGRLIDEFFETMADFVDRMSREGKGSTYNQRLRLTSAERTQPAWSSVEIAWDNASRRLSAVTDSLARLGGALADLDEYDIPDADDLALRLLSAHRALETARTQLDALVNTPEPNGIYWAEILPDHTGRRGVLGRLVLNAAPLHVGSLVEKHLLMAKQAVVMTSATLRTGGTFDFIRERLQAQDADTLALDSPFDYSQSTLLYLTTDVPEPGQNGHQGQVEQALIHLCIAMGGRTLVLFTAYNQLRTTARVLASALRPHGINVYEQGSGASRRQLLDNFKQAERAVLLGTRSFWEGVDVPGEALSCLAIIRLPFAVPTDPIFAARSEQFEQPFMEYSVPDAILRFRQGFGRLIRTSSDRGVVAVLDRRVLTKTYGPSFLSSLPECRVHKGPVEDIMRVVGDWMASPET
jgi:ATP-dependent DNA helicase DinG